MDRPGAAVPLTVGASGLGLKPGSLGVVASSLKVDGWVGKLGVVSKSEVTAISVKFWLGVVGNCVWGMSVGLELWVIRKADCGLSVGLGWVIGSNAEFRFLVAPGS